MSTTRKITIQITQQHLDESLYDDSDLNPISLAISDVFGPPCKLRGVSKTLSLWHASPEATIPMTKEVYALYVRHLDGELTPTIFEIDAPEAWFQVDLDKYDRRTKVPTTHENNR